MEENKKSIGQELNDIGHAFSVINSILSCIVGIAFAIVFGMTIGFFAVLIGVVICVLGVFISRILYLVLYAFGKLVDNSQKIAENASK